MGEWEVEFEISSYSQCIEYSPSTDVNEILSVRKDSGVEFFHCVYLFIMTSSNT